MFYNTYYPNGGLFKGKNWKPTLKELQQIISSNYTGTKISGKYKPDLVQMFKKLYEDSTLSPQSSHKSSPLREYSPTRQKSDTPLPPLPPSSEEDKKGGCIIS